MSNLDIYTLKAVVKKLEKQRAENIKELEGIGQDDTDYYRVSGRVDSLNYTIQFFTSQINLIEGA